MLLIDEVDEMEEIEEIDEIDEIDEMLDSVLKRCSGSVNRP
jgi:hypothetical protein